MGFKDLDLKISYDSNTDDILNDFYIPLLSNSIKYQRSVGFFSSKILSVAAEGIINLINNGGTIELICGTKLKGKDLDIIKKAHENPDIVIEEFRANKSLNLIDKFKNNHLMALGWMVAKGILKIKIAMIVDEDNPLDEKKGILHQKIGIFRDIEGNIISFSGSNNETASGWEFNIEEFKVFRNWKKSESPYLTSDLKKFNDIWMGNVAGIKVIDSDKAVLQNEIKILAESKTVLNQVEKTDKIELWDYQKDAIEKWIKNGKKGIFEMATGTGKTFTALGCLNQELKKTEKLLIVITAPYQHLLQQWKQSINKFGLDYDDLIIADSTNRFWKDKLADSIFDISLGHKNKVIVISTHRTFSSDNFKDIINYKDDFKIFLIADEVHGLGAEYSKLGLINAYDFRLGLSATPKRWFDDYGTDILHDYFNGVIYEFDLEKAINKTNPATNETYLTPYLYKPKFISLKSNELDEYYEITKQIAVKYGSKKLNDDNTALKSLLFKRANIIKNAEEKYPILEEILDDIGNNLKWTIIYCTEHQIDKVMNILKKRRISAHLFTMSEGTRPDKKYDGLSERDFILKKFIEGYYKVLVAIKCLDEGVDIPPARIAIMMASSGNPREHIQRLGRVIRRFSNKKRALIYDLFVLPNLKKFPSEFKNLERRIFEKEFERYEEIASIAINNAEALEMIYDAKYKLR
ncbi:MAG: DEAD/DEAH box helicase family protein [Candidatus Methanofastidiosum sp.]|nr:DEAD/DEAH box helicase family protein [Methanofastidiosum sp.]